MQTNNAERTFYGKDLASLLLFMTATEGIVSYVLYQILLLYMPAPLRTILLTIAVFNIMSLTLAVTRVIMHLKSYDIKLYRLKGATR